MVLGGCRSFLFFSNYAPSKLNIKPVRFLFKNASTRSCSQTCRLSNFVVPKEEIT